MILENREQHPYNFLYKSAKKINNLNVINTAYNLDFKQIWCISYDTCLKIKIILDIDELLLAFNKK
jgi:hypothetical protein